jgi:uncharacterized RDD family membrane protein YckC
VQSIVEEYIYTHHSQQPRYDIDLNLLRAGYSPLEIELVWEKLRPARTPEIENWPKASFGKRLLAVFYDAIIMSAILCIAFIPLMFVAVFISPFIAPFIGSRYADPLENVNLEPMLALELIGVAVYYRARGYTKGQTLGHKLAGIHFVTAALTPPKRNRALISALLPIVFLLTLCLLNRQIHLGWFCVSLWLGPAMWFGPARRSLYDRGCGFYALSAKPQP